MSITERAKQLLHDRQPFVHATVVRAQQPTSARAGDEAILLADGTIEGFVGGQCAQSSVRTAALGALQAGESVLLRVLPDGEVHFPYAPGACVVVNPCLSGGALEIFLAPQFPAPLVRICGATPIAEELARVCGVLGYDVSRDGERGFDGATAVVIATHGGTEADTIRAALNAGVAMSGWWPAGCAVTRCSAPSVSPTTNARGCIPLSACRSAPRRLPRSRCRSLRR